jgi:hypothetical protein
MSKYAIAAVFLSIGLLTGGEALVAGLDEAATDTEAIYDVAARGGSIWAGWHDGIYFSSDYGRTWRRYDTTSGFGPGRVSAIALAADTIWTATYYSVVNGGAEYYLNGGIYSGALDNTVWQYHQPLWPEDPGNIIYDIVVADTVIWTANWWKSLQRSVDGGATWELVLPDTVPYLNPRERLNQRVFSVAADGDVIWAGSQDGLNRSLDGGQSWTTLRCTGDENGPTANKIAALAFRDSSGVRQLWAAAWTTFTPGEASGLAVSSDTGRTWRKALTGQRVWNLFFNEGDVFAAADSGLWFSANGGDTFVNISVGKLPGGTPIYSVAMTDDGRLWVGTAGGLYHVLYSGVFWEMVDYIQLPAGNDPAPVPGRLSIGPCRPNPFNPETTIPLYLPQTGRAELVVFDILGRKQRTLATATMMAGEHHVTWDGRDDRGLPLASGIYFCRFTDGRSSTTQRLILLR